MINNYQEIYGVLAGMTFIIMGLYTFKKRIVVLKTSMVYLNSLFFIITFYFNNIIRYGLDLFSILLIIILVIPISIFIIYDVKFNKGFTYFNSEEDVIEQIVLDVLRKNDIAYTIDQYLEIVIGDSKARIIISRDSVKIKKYKSIPGHEILIIEIYNEIIKNGYTKRSYSSLLLIIAGIFFIFIAAQNKYIPFK